MVDPNLSPEVQAQEIQERDITEAQRRGVLDWTVTRRRVVVEIPALSVSEKRKWGEDNNSEGEDEDNNINLDIMVAKVHIGLCWFFLDLADIFF